MVLLPSRGTESWACNEWAPANTAGRTEGGGQQGPHLGRVWIQLGLDPPDTFLGFTGQLPSPTLPPPHQSDAPVPSSCQCCHLNHSVPSLRTQARPLPPPLGFFSASFLMQLPGLATLQAPASSLQDQRVRSLNHRCEPASTCSDPRTTPRPHLWLH